MSHANSFLSTLAILAAASAPTAAPSDQEVAREFLRTASQAALRLTPCRQSAGDLVGETALRMWSRHRDVLGRGRYRGYVESVLRNLRRDHVRRWHRTPLFTDLDGDGAEFDPTPTATATEDASSLASATEFRESLSPDDQGVLEQLEAGRSTREIAELVGRTRHAVRASVGRIRERARAHFLDHA